MREGLTVVAGLAEGINTAAHTPALDEGGRTVTVTGSGISQYLPAVNRDLRDVLADRGLLMCQLVDER